MELKVYDWEYVERWKVRYFIFTFVVLIVVILSIMYSNFVWWVLVLLFAAWYLYILWKVKNTVNMVIWKKALQINKIIFPWETLNWFVLEYHIETKKIHNIVIVDNKKSYRIYTIKDTNKNLEAFVNELNWYIPLLDNYEQSSLDKFIRRIKL